MALERETRREFRRGPAGDEQQPLRQRLVHLHGEWTPRSRIRPPDGRRNGGGQRRHSGAFGIFGFTSHKQSFFGDLHCMGRDGFIFYTESKNVTTTWFTGKAIPAKPSTWDGTMTR